MHQADKKLFNLELLDREKPFFSEIQTKMETTLRRLSKNNELPGNFLVQKMQIIVDKPIPSKEKFTDL